MISRTRPAPETQPAAIAAPVEQMQAVPVAIVTNVGSTPQLNSGRTECRILTYCLIAETVIYYKASASWVMGVGKIEKFMYAGYQEADKASVWMLIVDAQDGQKEWVSVVVWAEQKEKGFFNTEIIKEQPAPLEVKRPIQF